MRGYQEKIMNAVINKSNWGGCNVLVNTTDNVTKVSFYGNLIATVNHSEKSAKYYNCGYNNACTSARINAVKMACEKLGYN